MALVRRGWLVQAHAPAVMLAQSRVGAGVGGGARGWNADQFGQVVGVAASTAPPARRGRGGWGTEWRRGYLVVGTLLGPEGTGRSAMQVMGHARHGCHGPCVGGGCFFCVDIVLASYRSGDPGGWWCRVGGDRPYVENCTVDASILFVGVSGHPHWSMAGC